VAVNTSQKGVFRAHQPAYSITYAKVQVDNNRNEPAFNLVQFYAVLGANLNAFATACAPRVVYTSWILGQKRGSILTQYHLRSLRFAQVPLHPPNLPVSRNSPNHPPSVCKLYCIVIHLI
jgi:hypothetical protein